MRTLLLAAALVLLCGACGGAERGDATETGAAAGDGDEVVAIRCAAFYRTSVTTAEFEEESFLFGAENGRERARFAELVLAADHVNDAYEGRGLVLYVREPGSEERLAQQTYAFEHGEAVENVFGDLPDGHGFTGIHYHYSGGGAELQYYCGRE